MRRDLRSALRPLMAGLGLLALAAMTPNARAESPQPMNRQEILLYERLHCTPASRDAKMNLEDNKRLADSIQRRGVDFAYDPRDPFYTELQRAGGTIEVVLAIQRSYHHSEPVPGMRPQPAYTGPPPFSKEELLEYERSNVTPSSVNWFHNFQDNHRLQTMIQERGVDFRYSPMDPFVRQMRAAGATAGVLMAIERNYRQPPSYPNVEGGPTEYPDKQFFIGVWQCRGADEPITPARSGQFDDRMARWHDHDMLDIRSDGTYTWRDRHGSSLNGRWVPVEEHAHSRGEGVLLTGFLYGGDWMVVRQPPAPGANGDWIAFQMGTQRYVGFRVFHTYR